MDCQYSKIPFKSNIQARYSYRLHPWKLSNCQLINNCTFKLQDLNIFAAQRIKLNFALDLVKCRQSTKLCHLKRLAGRAGLRARGTLGHISHHLLGSNQAAWQSDRCSALDTDTNTLQTSPHCALPPRANTPCRGQNAIYLPTISNGDNTRLFLKMFSSFPMQFP